MEEAAKNIGISKKSLDDYFLQLRNGHLNGFNFNEHKNDKIGILRSFNKQKSKQKKTSGQHFAFLKQRPEVSQRFDGCVHLDLSLVVVQNIFSLQTVR